MRICLYTETALPKLGGQEIVVDTLARHFVEAGHDVAVLAPRPKKLVVADEKLPYLVYRHPRFISTRRLVSWYRYWLLRQHRRHAFDVLHCHSVYPCGYLGALAHQQLKTPLIITSHGGDVRLDNPRWQKSGLRERHELAIRQADALVSISRFTREGYQRLHADPGRIVSIPNGVEAKQFATPAKRPSDLPHDLVAGRYLMFLGRLAHRKAVDVLLEALARLMPLPADIRLVIAGDGEQRGALVELTQRLGLTKHVYFAGAVTGQHKAYLLQNARCLVAPTRDWETFGLVVIESYAAGRPVVVSNLAGMADLVQAGQNGLLVEPGSATSLAAALQTMLFDDAQVAHLASQATASVAQYQWRHIAQQHLELYAKLCLAPDTVLNGQTLAASARRSTTEKCAPSVG